MSAESLDQLDADQPVPDRKPWVTPSFERESLKNALTANTGTAIIDAGITYS